jgi:hypothetical protein
MKRNLLKSVPKSYRRAKLRPRLRFSPAAWAKLLYLRDRGDSEIGGFGLTSTDDPLLVTDLALVDQTCTAVSVKLNAEAVADFFDRQVELGLKPAQFARIWIHTHPGRCPQPSATDELTFARVFGPADWSVMLILAKGGRKYARLQFSAGPRGALELPVRVDYSAPFAASDEAAWEAEYLAHVTVDQLEELTQGWSPHGSTKAAGAPLGLPASTGLPLESELNDPVNYPEECWYD